MRSKEELIRIARLAKLSTELEDFDVMLNDMSDVLDVVESITDIELSGYDTSEETQISGLREDVVKPSLPAQDILSGAMEKKDNYFIV